MGVLLADLGTDVERETGLVVMSGLLPSSSVPLDLLSVLHGVKVLVNDSASDWLLLEFALDLRLRPLRRPCREPREPREEVWLQLNNCK